jgi:Protein of unknown function (DUF3159)
VTAGPPEESPSAERRAPTLLEQMGGVPGIIASTIPVAVFVVVNIVGTLQPALIAALASGVVIAIVRISRKQPLQPAVSGLFGVGIAAFIAYRTGEARGFYLPGLIYSAVLALAFLVSVLVRWPLAGVIWHGINGDGQSWRRDSRLLRAYTWASLLWTLVFAARLVVQGLLYNADATTWLGIARLVMGYPLVGVALLGTVWAVTRARRAPNPAEEQA